MSDIEKNYSTTAVIDGVAATAAEASRTAITNVTNSESYGIGIALTYHMSTYLCVNLYKSQDGGTNYCRVPSISIAFGTGTLSDYTAQKAVDGDETVCLDLDVRNCTHVKAIISATNGDATDLITARVCHS